MVSQKKQKTPCLDDLLAELRLSEMRQYYGEAAQQATAETLSYESYLQGLAEREVENRKHNRISRLLRQSRLPLEKSLDTFDLSRMPNKIVQQIRSLLDGQFLDRTENIRSSKVQYCSYDWFSQGQECDIDSSPDIE